MTELIDDALRDEDAPTQARLRPLLERLVAVAEQRAAVVEREACAEMCDAIADDKHAQFKGRPPHEPNNPHRADPYTEGESDGADLCAAAIRKR